MDNGKDQLATGSLYLSIDSMLAAAIGGVYSPIPSDIQGPLRSVSRSAQDGLLSNNRCHFPVASVNIVRSIIVSRLWNTRHLARIRGGILGEHTIRNGLPCKTGDSSSP